MMAKHNPFSGDQMGLMQKLNWFNLYTDNGTIYAVPTHIVKNNTPFYEWDEARQEWRVSTRQSILVSAK